MKSPILFGLVLIAFSTAAQVSPGKPDTAGTNQGEARYCAMLIEGKMVLMKDNAPVAADVSLKNGSSISKDGSIRRKDGTTVSLGNGDCVDNDGNVLPRKVQSEKKEMQKHEPGPGNRGKQNKEHP